MKLHRLTGPLFAALFVCAGAVQAAEADVVPKGQANEARKSDAKTDKAKKAEPKKADGKTSAGSVLVDLNTAGKSQLKMLPGVDDRLADKIIRGRPYKAKAELVTRRIVPQDAYQAFRGLIVAKPL